MPDELSADDRRVLATDVIGWTLDRSNEEIGVSATLREADGTFVMFVEDWRPDLDDAQAAMVRRAWHLSDGYLQMTYSGAEVHAKAHKEIHLPAGEAWEPEEALASTLAILRAQKAKEESDEYC